MQSSAPPSGKRKGIGNKIVATRNKMDDAQNKVKYAFFPAVAPVLATGRAMLGNTTFDQVTEEETVAAFVYKMDKPWLQSNELRVEIRWGNALWVIGEGDETIKVKLQKNHKMRLSKATASMSADGVLTVVIPKRFRPRKCVSAIPSKYEDKEVYQDGLVLRRPSYIPGGQALWGYNHVRPGHQGGDGVGLSVKDGQAVADPGGGGSGDPVGAVGQGDETVKVKLPRSNG
ncbi:hypothetical protein NL676_029027 [Syzygium grande]|nr:hypothetical protein NL676_029027 [Syzygium grande]